MRKILLITGLLLLFIAEILKVYLLAPFPGSQQTDTIRLAYFLSGNIAWIRMAGLAMIVYPAWFVYKRESRWKKTRLSFFLVAYLVIAVFFNFSNTAAKHVLGVSDLHFAIGAQNKVPGNEVVMGVVINGRAKAYPVALLGYHRQVADTFGFVKVMVTYSAESRSGRVYSAFIDVLEKFVDLTIVGLNDYNTVMQDDSTKSWWQQESGIAVTGPLTGSVLKKLPVEQMTLASWQRKHPGSLVMQPGSGYVQQVNNMGRNELIQPDTASWQPRSLIVGVEYLETTKAYDWNRLVKEQIIEDSLPLYPVLLLAENDKISFHSYSRFLNGSPLHFTLDKTSGAIKDIQTNSTWHVDGVCTDGPLKGNMLTGIQSYQEFWRAWKNFHPDTKIFK